MTKLEIGKEYWIKAKFLEDDNSYFKSLLFEFVKGADGASWIAGNIEAVEVIPEREKVTIPKFVAEWIEEHKGQFSTVYTAFSILTKREYGIKKWVNDNQDTFARAWLDGYEVEEPLGVLLVDIPRGGLWKYNYLYGSVEGDFRVSGCDEATVLLELAHKVTEAEAKEKYPNFKWVSLEELENDL